MSRNIEHVRGSQEGVVPAMSTARQHRQQAKECLELAKAAKDFYVKEAMAELAEEFGKTAELLEHPALGR
jgi:hypothetical protein